MACRAARLSRDLVRMHAVCCCKCGSTNVEVLRTSMRLGPHLCQICAQQVVRCGTGKVKDGWPLSANVMTADDGAERLCR